MLRAGVWYLVIEEIPHFPEGLNYRVLLLASDPHTGECLVPDGDGDGVSLCDRDCDDGDPRIHPGADEVCDGLNNDCVGGVDDPRGECDTGAAGICSAGAPHCNEEGVLTCRPHREAEAEVCDGEDNDCDGEIDEAGCDPPLGGESCAEPLDLEIGVVLEGSLEGARNDHLPGRDCFPEDGPDHVLRFELPGDPGQDEVEVRIDTEGTRHGVFFSLRREDCEAGEGPGRREGCFEDDRGFEGSLRAGVWYLVIEGTPRFPEGLNYRVTVTIVL